MQNLTSNQNQKGFFIVFEGGEGTGKTTQIKELKSKLESTGRDVLVSFEPGGTPLGSNLRSLLLESHNLKICSKAEALMMAASRAQHVEEVIIPALQSNKIVLCDRYWDASLAYQGVGRGLGIQPIRELNLWATGGLAPDKVFLFDLNPAQGLNRAKNRAKDGVLDRLEQESLQFHEKVREGYLEALKQSPQTHTRVDASQNVDDISSFIWEQVQSLLKNRASTKSKPS